MSFDPALFTFYADELRKAFFHGYHGQIKDLADIGIEYGQTDPAMLTAFETNLFRFSAAKSLKEVQEMNQLFRKSKDVGEFKKMAKAASKQYQKNWLETEYNTAVTTGEQTATYHRLRKQSETFPYWKYMTAEDGKVRPEHVELDGLVLEQRDPRWNDIYPPNGWNCRCYVIPLTKGDAEGTNIKAERQKADAFKDSSEYKQAKANGFGVNRAATGEVFTQNQFYSRKFKGKAKKKLMKLKHSDYGLPNIDKVKRSGTIKPYEGTPEDFYASLEGKKTDRIIRDYENRPIKLNRDKFIDHTTDRRRKRKYRTKYLNALKETLSHPDEVWINNHNAKAVNNYQYIKHYEDKSIIVSTKMNSFLEPEIRTWFPLQIKKKSIVNKYRRGLLIQKASKE